MAAPATCVFNLPVTGTVYEIAEGDTTVTFNCTGTTDPSVTVQMLDDGSVIGSPVTSTGGGAFTAPLTLAAGTYDLTARAGTNPEFTVSTPAHVITVRPTIKTAATVTWYFNWLADTIVAGVPQYTAKRAACLWAGVPLTYTMAGALNTVLANPPGLWVSVNQALNEIAETSGLGNSNALKAICEAEVS